jgi:hypothetical protein
MREDPEPEIITVCDDHIRLFDTGGSSRMSCPLPFPLMEASFLYDYDGDNKLDLVLGSHNSGNLAISVVNGCGDLISSFQAKHMSENYSLLLPQCIAGNSLYTIAQGSWTDSPRGVISYSLEDFTEQWFFSLPSNPTGLAIQRRKGDEVRFTISHFVHLTGQYNYIGTHKHKLPRGDTSIRLYQTNHQGEVLSHKQLTLDPAAVKGLRTPRGLADSTDSGNEVMLLGAARTEEGIPITGFATFHPLSRSSNGPVLLIQQRRPPEVNVPLFFLHIVRPPPAPSGGEEPGTEMHKRGIISSNGAFAGEVDMVRFLPSSDDPDTVSHILVLSREEMHIGTETSSQQIYHLQLFDTDLNMIQKKTFTNAQVCLGPVLTRAQDHPSSSPLVFVAVGAQLALLDRGFHEHGTWEVTHPARMIFFTSMGKHYLALAGDYFHLFELVMR